jgi:hypothetical protein
MGGKFCMSIWLQQVFDGAVVSFAGSGPQTKRRINGKQQQRQYSTQLQHTHNVMFPEAKEERG